MARFVVGIDLGTTNSALAYADTRGAQAAAADAPTPIQTFDVPQLVGVSEVAARPTLPSFLYLPAEKEFAAGALDLPWDRKAARAVGLFAREHGAKVPGRLVSSAKSWLSHGGVDRRAPLLPWAGAPDVEKVSPVAASASYLIHLRDAWKSAIAGKDADARLESQEVLLTVPASFDAVARELTVEAARAAGLENVTLIEEPQAAFYAWLAGRGEAWRSNVHVGDRILVCDVGGGTTDFTLIGVTDRAGDLDLVREAVGEHILLGGDNMDLALAYAVATDLPGGMGALDPVQRVALTYAVRAAKEALFSEPSKKTAPVAVLGRGSKVIGGSVKTELSRDRLDAVLLDGFFPACEPTDQPARGRRVGLTEIGLPYAADPAVSRHLARFLNRQGDSLHASHGFAQPSAVLFNGGVFKAGPLRERVVSILSTWGGQDVPVLSGDDPDLAVARGAAYYGLVRRGQGIRIRGGVPRAYYVGIEGAAPAVPGVPPPLKAVCVVPLGMEEGTETDVPGPEFGLIVGEPAEFRFLSSTTRRDDLPGTVLDRWQPDELQEHDPLEATLDGPAEGQAVPVRLHSHVTEVGTLDLWCQATRGEGHWKLQYNVRDAEAST
jgi:molecular chaperone DnaK (HSP70)